MGKGSGASFALRLALLLSVLMCGCSPKTPSTAEGDAANGDVRMPSVTVSGDESGVEVLNWQPPTVQIAPDELGAARRRAEKALAEDRLYATADDAVPLYLAISKAAPDDQRAKAGLEKSLDALLQQGSAALKHADDKAESLRRAREIAAVVRTLKPEDEAVLAYMSRVDEVEQLSFINPVSGETIEKREELYIYPAKHFVMPEERIAKAVDAIKQELEERLELFPTYFKVLTGCPMPRDYMIPAWSKPGDH